MVVWAGISFQQSASVEYFRRVRHMLNTLGRLNAVPQVLVNPSEEPYFNLLSAMSNPNELQLLDLRETSDIAFPAMAQRVQQAIMREDDECRKIVAAHTSSVNNGVHIAAGALAAAAAARVEPAQAADMAAEGEDLGPGGSECAARATALCIAFGAKTEVQGLSSIKLEAGNSAVIGTSSGIPSECCLPDGGPMDATASGSAPEPGSTPVRSWHMARSAKISRAVDEVEEVEPSFVDDADDQDYIEGEDEKEGRCRRNGRGRGRGRAPAGRVRGRGRGRGRGGGSGARTGAHGSANSSQMDQSPLSLGQTSLGQLFGLTPGAELLGAVSSECSILPLAQPGLRLAFGALPQLQQQQLTQVVQQPQLPLFQQLQKQETPQQVVQPLQQLQQLLQLAQLAQLRQQLQGAQQQSPALAPIPQQHQQGQQMQVWPQAQGAIPPHHVQQLSPVQFVSPLSTVPHFVAGNALLGAQQSRLLGQDALAPQQELPHPKEEAQSVQAQDQPVQHQHLVGLQQRTLLQQDTHGGCHTGAEKPHGSQPGMNVSGVWPEWFAPSNGEIVGKVAAAPSLTASSVETTGMACGGSAIGLLPLATVVPSSVAHGLTTVMSNLKAPMPSVSSIGDEYGALPSGASLSGPDAAPPVEPFRGEEDTG
ncbi:hypothetical protein Vretifemale_2635 [Volvox reticuliferus]|nr:hypothetical protein Vretifemale_2635 [Volvox reticuliferus]